MTNRRLNYFQGKSKMKYSIVSDKTIMERNTMYV